MISFKRDGIARGLMKYGSRANAQGRINPEQTDKVLRDSWADYYQREGWLLDLGVDPDDFIDLSFNQLPKFLIERMKRHWPGSPG